MISVRQYGVIAMGMLFVMGVLICLFMSFNSNGQVVGEIVEEKTEEYVVYGADGERHVYQVLPEGSPAIFAPWDNTHKYRKMTDSDGSMVIEILSRHLNGTIAPGVRKDES